MGWLWSSGPAPKASAADASAPNAEPQPTSIPKTNHAAEPVSGDPEIAKFMAQIQAEFGGGSNASTKPDIFSSSQPTSTSSQRSSWSTPPSPPSDAVRLDAVSESLLPTTMSCRQAFDQAFHCNSLGGQWTSVFRSGGMRSCSDQWDDFWFCMRTRAYSGTVKEEAIRDYYRQKEIKKYGPGMPNSTDIWEPRTEKLPPGSAFQGRYEKPNISDEEWRRQEIERRKMIQRMLKEEEERTSSS
ncbi:hypothetical protein GQX73_g3670 [Xylaria multiplex]|uniref:Early meiotic induction protein 1 n=1 Tax=Xylaria multiplex TaxID=323545 RepID=A0A7C8IZ33_9PEZI|nr:hypothetical protein GQX73_g3670 [Xylaria multiplex]